MLKSLNTKKVNQISELYDDLDAQLDAKAYAQLDRTAPAIVEAVEGLVAAGVEPGQILTHVLAKYPAMWVEGQAIRSSARHAKRLVE